LRALIAIEYPESTNEVVEEVLALTEDRFKEIDALMNVDLND